MTYNSVPICGKGFNMQTSLDKHKYYHKELKFVCEHCGQGFPFLSRLEQHKVTHRTIALYLVCIKTVEEPSKISGISTGTLVNMMECGTHATSVHTVTKINELYGCQHYGKRFHFSMQYRRHQKSGCTLPPLAHSDSPTF